MNILPVSQEGPIGAVALLGYAEPVEQTRFVDLENEVWDCTCLL